jgi:hypothetical protein
MTPEKSSLDYLVYSELLNQEQKQLLESADIANGPQLVIAWRDEVKRAHILQQTRIPELTLVRSVLAANLLRLKGPGEQTAVALLANKDFDALKSVPADPRFHLKITAERQELMQFIVEKGLSLDSRPEKRFNAVMLAFVGLFFTVVIFLLIFEFRTDLFPILFADLNRFFSVILWRKTALLDIAWVVNYFVFLLLIVLVSMKFLDTKHIVGKWMDQLLGITPRHRLVWTDASSLIPPASKKLLGDAALYSVYFILFLLGLVAFILVLLVQQKSAISIRDAVCFVPAFVGLTVFLLLRLRAYHKAILRLGAEWAVQIRKIFAAKLLLKMLIDMGLLFLVAYGFTFLVKIQITNGLIWLVEQAHNSQAEIQSGFIDHLSDSVLRTEMHEANEQFWTDWVAKRQSIGQSAATGLDNVLTLQRYVIFGILFAVSVGSYAFVNHLKGAKAIAYSFLLLIGGDILVEWGPPLLESGQLFVIPITFSGFMILVIYDIAKDILGEGWKYRDHVECPHCYMLTKSGEAVCEHCKEVIQPLVIIQDNSQDELMCLVDFRVLSEQGVQRLHERGIRTASELTSAWLSLNERERLMNYLGLSFEDFTRIVITAKLLSVKGSGSLLARKMAENLNDLWDELEFDKENVMNNVTSWIEVDSEEMLELLDWYELDNNHGIGHDRAAKIKKQYGFFLFLFFVSMLARFMASIQPSVFFAYHKDLRVNDLLPTANLFTRLGFLNAFGTIMIMFALFWLIFFWLLPLLITKFSPTIQKLLRVETYQRVIFANALLGLRTTLLEPLPYSTWRWVYPAVLLACWAVIGTGVLFGGWDFSFGIPFLLLCLLAIAAELGALYLHKCIYLNQNRDCKPPRQGSLHASALLFSIILVFLLIFCGAVLFDKSIQGISGWLTGWVTNSMQHQVNEIAAKVDQDEVAQEKTQQVFAAFQQSHLQFSAWASSAAKHVSQTGYAIYLAVLLSTLLVFTLHINPKGAWWAVLFVLSIIAFNQYWLAKAYPIPDAWLYMWMLCTTLCGTIVMGLVYGRSRSKLKA